MSLKPSTSRSSTRERNLRRVIERSEPEWLGWVAQGKISNKHLEAILTLPKGQAEELLRQTMQHTWSATKLRERVLVAKGLKADTIAEEHSNNSDIRRIEESLTGIYGASVRIQEHPKVAGSPAGGVVSIRWTDYETLDGVLERMGYRKDL